MGNQIMKHKLIQVALAILLIIFISACERYWYVEIISIEDTSKPTFCFSSSHGCNDKGTWFTFISIHKIDQKTTASSMWNITLNSDIPDDQMLHFLTYGSVPTGWIQRGEMKPLEKEVYYSINGEYYFKIKSDHTAITFSYDEYFERLMNGTLP